MAAELVSQEPGPLQELGATEPLLPWHAVSCLQEFGAMAAELLAQASSPLQELPATGPVLLKQASMPMQFAGGRALPIPAEPTMTRIPQIAADTSHIRLFMFDPSAPYLGLPIFGVKHNVNAVRWCGRSAGDHQFRRQIDERRPLPQARSSKTLSHLAVSIRPASEIPGTSSAGEGAGNYVFFSVGNCLAQEGKGAGIRHGSGGRTISEAFARCRSDALLITMAV
jgi:hypothetical protein